MGTCRGSSQFDMTSVVAYCRSACEPQCGPSAVQRQADAILGDAQRNVSLIYLDAGVSGRTLERPALQQLIADCLAGTIATVVTQDPERLSRDSAKLLLLLDIFRDADVRVSLREANASRFSKRCSRPFPSSKKRRIRPASQGVSSYKGKDFGFWGLSRNLLLNRSIAGFDPEPTSTSRQLRNRSRGDWKRRCDVLCTPCACLN
jgi:hypothetical protein